MMSFSFFRRADRMLWRTVPFARLWRVALSVLALSVLSFSAPALMLPATAQTATLDADAPATLLPPLNIEALLQEDRRELESSLDGGQRIRPRRVGVAKPVNVTPRQWTRTPDDDHQWRHQFVAPGAKGLSLLFDRFDLPPGAVMHIMDPSGRWSHGPYRAGDATGGIHATPIVWNDTLIVEVLVPGDHSTAIDLRVRDAIPAYVRFGDALDRSDRATAKSGSCNIDVACPEADPYRDEVRSVVLYTYVANGNQRMCTGSLVNNTAEDGRPFFLTAEHCMSTEAEVNSSVYYWNFEHSTCRPQGSTASGSDSDDDPLEQTSSGAILRARYGNSHSSGAISGKPDLLLVELDDVADLGDVDVYFNGWDVTGAAPAETASIHHPNGDAKRIALDADAPDRTGYGQPPGGTSTTHWQIEAWDAGTTESGSSGAPLFGDNNRVIGVLSGGLAACASPGSASDNDEPDWFGALADGFDATDYGTTTFREWLDPLGTGTGTLDGANLSVLPVELASLTARGDAGALTVRWETLSETDNAGFRLVLTRTADAPQTRERLFSGRGTPTAGATYQHTIGSLAPGPYTVNLLQVDLDGDETLVGTTSAVVTFSGAVEIEPPAPHPIQRESQTTITVQETQHLRVTLYDLLGRPVQTLFDERARALDPVVLTLRSETLSPGTYFLRVSGESFAQTERVVISK